MKKIINIISASVLLIAAHNVNAQQLPLYSQYHAVPFLHNPSLAGKLENTNLSLIHKSMWRDIHGAPITSALTLEGPIQEKNIGLGAILFNDVTDITQRIGFSTSYAYHLKIDDENIVRFGLSLGVLDNRVDFSKAIVADAQDPFLLQSSQHKTSFDGGFGALYAWKDLEVGLATPQLFANKYEFSQQNASAYYHLSRHYLFTAKYVFKVVEDKGITAYPYVMMRYAKNAPVQFDINAVLDWDKRGWFAVTYRSGYAVGLNLGVKLNTSLRAGYAYDIAIGNIGSYAGGSHELFLGYTFGKKEEEKPIDNTATELSNAKQEIKLMDSLVKVLGEENKDRKEEIDQLKQELNTIKSSGPKVDSKPAPVEDKTKSLNDSTGSIRKDVANNFKDENGETVIPQYYVIVGAFKLKEGAMDRKAEFIKRGFNASNIMYNDVKKLFYVSVRSTANEEVANKELGDAKFGTPDAWILILK